MDVYSYENISGTVLNITPYTIPIGGDVVSNGSQISVLENYVGKGLRKYLNGVEQIQYVQRVPSTGELVADGKLISNYTYDQYPAIIFGQSTWTSADISAALSFVNPETDTNAPFGRGREVVIPARQFDTGLLSLSQLNSVRGGVRGSSFFKLSATVANALSAGTYGHISALNDYKKKYGVQGQGEIRNLSVFGNNSNVTAGGVVIHGYYCAPNVDGIAHNIHNCSFDYHTGDGIHIEGDGVNKMNQSCSWRMKANGNSGWGFYAKNADDMKHYSPGLGVNLLGACRIEHVATPYFTMFDMWNPNTGYKGVYTVELWDQSRAVFDTGSITGRLLISGRNDQGVSVRYDNTGIVFRSVDFKVDETLKAQYAAVGGSGATYDSAITIIDTDDVLLDSCKWMFADVTPDSTQIATAPDYAIKIETDTGSSPRRGIVRIDGAGGLVHKRGRVGEVAPILTYLKHFCNRPELIEWVGWIPGEARLVPNAFMASGARLDYLGPGTYNKADYPFAYLIFTSGTLDDVNTQFTIPAGPYTAPGGSQWVYRVWPV